VHQLVRPYDFEPAALRGVFITGGETPGVYPQGVLKTQASLYPWEWLQMIRP